LRALRAIGCALSALPLCASCVSRLDLSDLDRLERSLDARTVALERDYSLWSPFAVAQTEPWLRMIDEELHASSELFGTRPSDRLMIGLVPIQGLGLQFSSQDGKVTVAWQKEHPLHGVAGMSGGRRILVYVTPDQELETGEGPVVAHRGADDYRGTLRHELAHVFALESKLAGPSWFYEGLADLVQSYALEEGRLVDRGPSFEDRLVASTIAPEHWGVPRLLDWREDGARVAAGEEAVDKVSRALCGWFVRFLFQQDPRSTLHQTARAVSQRSRQELEALEPAWREWLATQLGHPNGTPDGGRAGNASAEP